MSNKNFFSNPRLRATLLLAFASGLPLALTSSTLQAWFTQAGIGVMAIGALSLTGIPYIYKFLWAPLLDRFSPGLLGRRRGWIMIFQLALVLTLSLMALLNPKTHPWALAWLALATAFMSASQDIVLDAYRVDLLKPDERAPGASLTVLGYRLAMLVSGGLALILADYLGWRSVYLAMAGLMALEILITLRAPEPDQVIHTPKTLAHAVIQPFQEFLARSHSYWILLFIFIYKLSNVFALALMSVFLLRYLNFSLTDIGTLYKTVGLIATLIGAFAGGLLVGRIGVFRSLLIFGILQSLSVLGFAGLAWLGKNYYLLASVMFVENFCDGLATISMVAFVMSLCDKRYSATQYAVFSAIEALPRTVMGPIAALITLYIGWSEYFILASLLGLPGLLILYRLRKPVFEQPLAQSYV